jgi:hypothetical protein
MLRHGLLAKRPEFLGDDILALEYSSQATFAALDIAIDFPISVSESHSETAFCAL